MMRIFMRIELVSPHFAAYLALAEEDAMPAKDQRKPTNLSLDARLVEQARARSLNLSRAAEDGIRAALLASDADLWRAENADAIQSSNEYVEARGLPLKGYRAF